MVHLNPNMLTTCYPAIDFDTDRLIVYVLSRRSDCAKSAWAYWLFIGLETCRYEKLLQMGALYRLCRLQRSYLTGLRLSWGDLRSV